MALSAVFEWSQMQYPKIHLPKVTARPELTVAATFEPQL